MIHNVISGFECFKTYFENVNKNEHRLKKDQGGGTLIVEKTELLGLDYLWELCLNIPDEIIADSAIQLLLNVSYSILTSKLKKVRFLGQKIHFVHLP